MEHLRETGQHAKEEHEDDRAVQPGVRDEDRRDLRIGKKHAHTDSPEDRQHLHDLPDRLRKLRAVL